MSKADDFIRAQSSDMNMSTVPTSRQSTTGRSSMALVKKVDPYALDFSELRKQYETQSTVKLPFVKSSVVHYSKCPRNMKINGKEYTDLVVTMEVIQAPNMLNYTQLQNPKLVKEQEKERRKEEREQARKNAIAKAKADKKAAKVAKIAAAKAEKKAAREAKIAAKAAAKEARIAARAEKKNARIQSASGSEEGSEAPSDDDYDEESGEGDDDYDEESGDDGYGEESGEDSEIDLDDLDLDLGSEFDEDEESGEGSGYGSEEGSGSDDSSGSGSGSDNGEDREYTGDMFDKVQPVKFLGGKFESLGQHNHKLETNDYCCISIWSTGGKLMRYTRLKDTTLRVPPLEAD